MTAVDEHATAARAAGPARVALVGTPNVGKSALLNRLTQRYVATVSNYPGTTVEVYRGECSVGGRTVEVLDTPGMYSLLPLTEEERVGRRLLLDEPLAVVLHVVDAKNLERHLPMTLQLLEAGLPVLLVINMLDEARAQGVQIDTARLAAELGVPVAATVGTTGEGIPDLLERLATRLAEAGTAPPGGAAAARRTVAYPPAVEEGLRELGARLAGRTWPLSPRTLALLLLSGDTEIQEYVRAAGVGPTDDLAEIGRRVRSQCVNPVEFEVAVSLSQQSAELARLVMTVSPHTAGFREQLSTVLTNPWTGYPILALVLYIGLYRFVGTFGAGTVVDLLEDHLFARVLTPLFAHLAEQWIPWAPVRDLLVGDCGVLSLGLRYAVAIVLPIVSFFFLVFAVIEDSGYLPRLALLLDRTFKQIGLSGRAVIPMVLGLGCATMATLVTRTLPTWRERVISTLLLALAVPCSAQLGVILALLEGRHAAVAVWAGVVILVFLLIGFLTARLLPGERPSFYMEVPPVRFPHPVNVLRKTWARMTWYFLEILPVFLGASVVIWLGKLTGVFALAVRALRGPVEAIGLPPAAADVFLFGFFRRDYGAAGLYDLTHAGLLSNRQLVVACVALTLFLPCIAQFLMNIRERGWRMGLAISAFTLVFSFSVAFALNWAWTAVGGLS